MESNKKYNIFEYRIESYPERAPLNKQHLNKKQHKARNKAKIAKQSRKRNRC